MINLIKKIFGLKTKVTFGKIRFPKNYQRGVGMDADERLHKNSMELRKILVDNNIISKIHTVFGNRCWSM